MCPGVRGKPRAIHSTIAPFSLDLFFDLFSVCLFFWRGRVKWGSGSLFWELCWFLLLLCRDFQWRGFDFPASLGESCNFFKNPLALVVHFFSVLPAEEPKASRLSQFSFSSFCMRSGKVLDLGSFASVCVCRHQGEGTSRQCVFASLHQSLWAGTHEPIVSAMRIHWTARREHGWACIYSGQLRTLESADADINYMYVQAGGVPSHWPIKYT